MVVKNGTVGFINGLETFFEQQIGQENRAHKTEVGICVPMKNTPDTEVRTQTFEPSANRQTGEGLDSEGWCLPKGFFDSSDDRRSIWPASPVWQSKRNMNTDGLERPAHLQNLD